MIQYCGANTTRKSCWDGKNLDSPDHKSHVAYPIDGAPAFTGSSVGGQCPDTHPVKIPQIMLEVNIMTYRLPLLDYSPPNTDFYSLSSSSPRQIVWDTSIFNDPNEWPEDGSQPFVLSTGDTTGYGQHGDYVFGWKGDSLQRAMDGGCLGASCTGINTQTIDEANKCSVPTRVDEDVDGCELSFLLSSGGVFLTDEILQGSTSCRG